MYRCEFDSYTEFYLQFRRTVADITKPEHDDYYLIRWLNGKHLFNITNVQGVHFTF